MFDNGEHNLVYSSLYLRTLPVWSSHLFVTYTVVLYLHSLVVVECITYILRVVATLRVFMLLYFVTLPHFVSL